MLYDIINTAVTPAESCLGQNLTNL